jgi:type I restriction enzyme R subunit
MKALMNFVKLHPANIDKKTQIIIEHFRGEVAGKLGGRAKAMLVTSSRLAAVKYTMAFKRYIEEKGYNDLGVIVAFSGSIDDGSGPRTESDINQFKTSEIEDKFATDAYQVMIVANKFQTGFDQPLLCAMYVDKVLTGIAAVQTLSRLNRMYPGKQEVFILDFVNDWADIKAAFENYYTVTELDRETDVNVIYSMERKLMSYHVFTAQEVESLTNLWYGERNKERILSQVLHWLEPARDRFDALTEEKQFEFREMVKKFIRSYGFITQMIRLEDEELHRLNTYLSFLYKELPRAGSKGAINLSDEVDLESIRIAEIGTDSVDLIGGKELKNTGGSPGIKKEEEIEPLSAIIQRMNERFGTDFTEADKILLATLSALEKDDELILQARVNSIEELARPFGESFKKALTAVVLENEEFFSAVGSNTDIVAYLQKESLPLFYAKAQEQ